MSIIYLLHTVIELYLQRSLLYSTPLSFLLSSLLIAMMLLILTTMKQTRFSGLVPYFISFCLYA